MASKKHTQRVTAGKLDPMWIRASTRSVAEFTDEQAQVLGYEYPFRLRHQRLRDVEVDQSAHVSLGREPRVFSDWRPPRRCSHCPGLCSLSRKVVLTLAPQASSCFLTLNESHCACGAAPGESGSKR